MNDRMKWFSGACVAACLAAGGVVVAGAGADGDSSPPAQPEVAAADSPPVTAIEPAQSEELGQLRRGRTTEDALPSRWREALTDDSGGDDHWGANPSLSRRTAPGVWIVPADGYTCVANASPDDGGLGFGCATPEDVERGLLAPSDVDANGNGVLTGVVPDGVGQVTLVDQDGSTRTAEVNRNTYRAAIDAKLKEVRFTSPDGTEHTLPMAWDG
jgi:hypothetical protein